MGLRSCCSVCRSTIWGASTTVAISKPLSDSATHFSPRYNANPLAAYCKILPVGLKRSPTISISTVILLGGIPDRVLLTIGTVSSRKIRPIVTYRVPRRNQRTLAQTDELRLRPLVAHCQRRLGIGGSRRRFAMTKGFRGAWSTAAFMTHSPVTAGQNDSQRHARQLDVGLRLLGCGAPPGWQFGTREYPFSRPGHFRQECQRERHLPGLAARR